MRPLGPVALAAALLLAGCSGDDGAAPATTPPATTSVVPTSAAVSSVPTSAPATAGVPATSAGVASPQGFGAISVRVDSVIELCLWLAATAMERQQGLMGVTSLGGADGMLFDFGGPSTGEFWMYQTVLPLSIAFYDAGGAFVSSTDMDPCTTASSSECARYGAAGPYAYAIEAAQGDLDRLGLVPGSTIELGGDCPTT